MLQWTKNTTAAAQVTAETWIQSLAQEPPYAMGVRPLKKKKKKKKKGSEDRESAFSSSPLPPWCSGSADHQTSKLPALKS